MSLITLVKDQKARFVHYREGHFVYQTDSGFQFPVPLEEVGNATLRAEDKALFFMRWIRRHVATIEAGKSEVPVS